MSEGAPKPLPHPDRDSLPFWEALRAGELRVQRCTGCGRLRWPARALCNACRSFEAEWVPLSGRGRVVSWVRNHRAFAPAWQAELPYVVVEVALAEQDDLRMIGRLDGGEPAGGLPVRARLVRANDDVTLVHWEPEPR